MSAAPVYWTFVQRMTSPLSRPKELHALIARRFPDALPSTSTRTEILASGCSPLDDALSGGLARGELLWLHAPWGGGGLSIASGWARHAAAEGGFALVVDARATTLPHAWVPASTRGAIWVARPRREHVWLALDLAIRAGGFELVVALDAPPARDAARVRRLVRERETRLLLVGEVAPLSVSTRVRVSLGGVRWIQAPHGDAPESRTLSVERGDSVAEVRPVHTDRLRPRPRAPDRRTSRHAKPR